MDKKEARKILGVSKEASKNDIERKYAILLKRKRLAKIQRDADVLQDAEVSPDSGVSQNIGIHQNGSQANGNGVHQDDSKLNGDGIHQDDSKLNGNGKVTREKQEEYGFDRITKAYNVLMGYEVKVAEEPPSKAAPILKKAGIDERKVRNFFYYYKFHILAVIAAVLVLVLTVRGCVNKVEPDFIIAFLGEISYNETDKLRGMIRENIPEIKEPGFDGAFVSDKSMADQQYAMQMKAMILFAAQDIDIFILDKVNYERYAKQGAFVSLDEAAAKLDVDMEENKEYILKIEETSASAEDMLTDEAAGTGEAVEVDTDGETSAGHLYGIDISHSKALGESGIYANEMIAALGVRGKQQDIALKVLRYLME